MNNSITQDMSYRQLMKYAEKIGVSRTNRKYNKFLPNLLLTTA